MRSDRSNRGFVLIAVLVIVGSAIMLTTSLLLLTQAQLATTSRSADAVQSRMLAWSGAQAVMAVLDEQRDAILNGRQPHVDRQYLIYETPDVLGVVRLLASGPGGVVPVSEAGKPDLNLINAEALVATGFVDADVAARIIEYRQSAGGYQSVGDLVRVPGVTADAVWGPLENLTPMDEAMGEGGDLAERVLGLHEQPAPRALADLVTVFAFEPNLQRNGRLRINLNVKWSPELGQRVQDRFGVDAAQGLQRIFQSGTVFDSERKIIEVLRSHNIEPKDWPEILDAFTTERGEYLAGRLDINTASYEALTALFADLGGGTEAGAADPAEDDQPLLQPDQAAQIVRMRAELTTDQRATIAWPVIQGIVPPQSFERLAGRITTRCWTFRVQLAAGMVPGDDPDAPLQRPVIYEAVIDLSAPSPRLAEFRDITLLQTAAALAAFAPEAEDRLALDADAGETESDRSDDDRMADAALAPNLDSSVGGIDQSQQDESLPLVDADAADSIEEIDKPAAPATISEPLSDPRRGRWKPPP